MASAVERAKPALPDLARTPALEIEAEDVQLPRLYIGQYTSEAVKEQLVKPGSLYTATGSDDPSPQVLADPKKAADRSDGGVVFYVLGLRKGKSYSEQGGELQLFDYNDPDAPPEAWVTYKYSLAIPDVDDEVPFTLLLTRTGRPAAKQINTVLKKNVARGPAWNNAFRLTVAKRENAKGQFFVPQVAVVEANPDHVSVAENLAVMIAGASSEIQATGEEPAI